MVAGRPSWLLGLLLTVLLTLPAWAPFLRPDLSLWQLFDGASHLRKSWLLAQLIKDGDWYPRWVPAIYGGYGYPTLNFYAPSTYYLTVAGALLPGVGLYGSYQLLGAGAAVGVVGGLYALGLAPVALRPGRPADGPAASPTPRTSSPTTCS